MSNHPVIYPINQTVLATIASARDPTKPVYMLNLWRFRPNAVYSPAYAHLSSDPCTGREATERYRAAIAPILPPGAAVHFQGNVEGWVAGPDSAGWDLVVIVRYETLQGFRDMVEAKKYREEVEPHRLAGLEEWRLVAMDGVGGVGF
ncbi:hypothetical protein C7974DRAFT_402974 [Boeremia exigua]|uniref:uncharacterized protein n=1 Tax=Boeremia exigua TaxID=749465 RepID=UPI001E8E6081|nr:uncharacterized protein C7974DRAFT_402974 [Boeremia exigua]KAH6614955.1 hypothetical protein C7974DRAFT_402974 [Boeremia exigua]